MSGNGFSSLLYRYFNQLQSLGVDRVYFDVKNIETVLRNKAQQKKYQKLNGNILDELARDLDNCQRCNLCNLGRTKVVFGVGNPSARLVFVGEAPGADEDKQGIPFVGRAGQLLTKMIEAMGLKREDVYICNVIKCRPPDNRDPQPDEIATCEPFLIRQLDIIQPEVIVCLGRYAAQVLTRDPMARITKIRGKWHEYQNIPLMPTFHPSYLLRNPAAKRETWADLQQVMVKLGLQLPNKR